ncbi:glycosyl hydrolases 18 family protein, partial [Vibrio harveyi]
ERRAC